MSATVIGTPSVVATTMSSNSRTVLTRPSVRSTVSPLSRVIRPPGNSTFCLASAAATSRMASRYALSRSGSMRI